MVQAELNMIRSFEQIDRDYKGYDIAQGLQAVVQSLARYPGRKTIVFFSEGLPASPALSARLDSVIEAANRANVTTYAVDAHGLRAKSSTNAIRKEMDVFAEERMIQNATGISRTEQPLTMALERVQDLLQLDSRTGLARLSQDTGGFLIEGSNDLSAAFRRIDEDNQFHYLLTYSPKNAAFDGKFRTIHVTVRAPGRAGICPKGISSRQLAARSNDTTNNDAPALALLDRTPLPNAFRCLRRRIQLPRRRAPGTHAAAGARRHRRAEASTSTRKGSTYSAQAAIVVRIRDGQGREVQRVSQQYLLAGDAKDLEAARRGDILFYREPDLPPGVYTMESIVFDAVARQGSVRVATLTIPARRAIRARHEQPGARQSGRGRQRRVRVEPRPCWRRSMSGGRSSTPISASRSPKSTTSELPFYFTLYGPVEGVKAYAQLLRNGEVAGRGARRTATSERLARAARRTIPHRRAPGRHLRVAIRVTDGRRELSRTAFFTVRRIAPATQLAAVWLTAARSARGSSTPRPSRSIACR